MKQGLLGIVVLIVTAAPASAEVKMERWSQHLGEQTAEGTIYYDGKYNNHRPAVLVLHEWWGHNSFAASRARMLARLGYVAMTLDKEGVEMYHHPQDAPAFQGELKQRIAQSRQRFLLAIDSLGRHPRVDPQRIAAVGYCFGGGLVLEMARRGVDLKGVVSFHGNFIQDNAPAMERINAVKPKILVLSGEEDEMITAEHRAKMESEMQRLGADLRLVTYERAKHSFSNPWADSFARRYKLPLAYNPKADWESWEEMQRFLVGDL
jgi:dienelactone hydrolase